jgi:hypothetical protein
MPCEFEKATCVCGKNEFYVIPNNNKAYAECRGCGARRAINDHVQVSDYELEFVKLLEVAADKLWSRGKAKKYLYMELLNAIEEADEEWVQHGD